MDSQNAKFALYGGTNECARTNMLLLLVSEVSTGAVSLVTAHICGSFDSYNNIKNSHKISSLVEFGAKY